MTDPTTDSPKQEAHNVIAELGLKASDRGRALRSSHGSSLPIICEAADGRSFLLKYFLPPREDTILPAGQSRG